jgi:hypothetical protein
MARAKKATIDGDGGGGKSTKKKQVSDDAETTVEEDEEAPVIEAEQGDEKDDEQVEEIWDLVRLILDDSCNKKTNNKEGDDDVVGTEESKKCRCRSEGCTNEARVVWANNLNPSDEWPLCLACQQKDFNGFPDDLSLPPDYYDNDRPFHSAAGSTSDSKEQENEDMNVKSNKNKAKANINVDESNDDDDGGYASGDEEEEQWDVKKIMSVHDVTNCPVLCSTEGCNLPAAVVLVSNLKPTEKWYSCIPCQVRTCWQNSLLVPRRKQAYNPSLTRMIFCTSLVLYFFCFDPGGRFWWMAAGGRIASQVHDRRAQKDFGDALFRSSRCGHADF